jgi:hypothetical protein
MDFAANHFIRGCAANHRFPRELLPTAWAVTWGLRVILDYPFDKTFDQCTFATFSIFK